MAHENKQENDKYIIISISYVRTYKDGTVPEIEKAKRFWKLFYKTKTIEVNHEQ